MTNRIPQVPMWLGAGGLIPFIALAIMLWVLPGGYAEDTIEWLLAYSAIILSFVGALHWGVALAHPEMGDRQRGLLMGWSVVPAIVAWIALSLHALAGILVMLSMFVVQLVADHILVRHVAISQWFIRLRQRLTIAVLVCLSIAAAYLLMN